MRTKISHLLKDFSNIPYEMFAFLWKDLMLYIVNPHYVVKYDIGVYGVDEGAVGKMISKDTLKLLERDETTYIHFGKKHIDFWQEDELLIRGYSGKLDFDKWQYTAGEYVNYDMVKVDDVLPKEFNSSKEKITINRNLLNNVLPIFDDDFVDILFSKNAIKIKQNKNRTEAILPIKIV